jgi:hypothetical protein
MRRTCFLGLLVLLLAGAALLACRRSPRPQPVAAQDGSKPGQVSEPSPARPADPIKPAKDAPLPPLPPVAADPGQEEKYDAALLDAVNLLSERKYAQALAALEAARAIQDTEQVRREIQRVRVLLEQEAAAERTVQDIQTVLNQGNPTEASRLATAALQQYGATDAAERLTRLKIQADALVSAQLGDGAARR